MNLKSNHFLLACLIATSLVLNGCGAGLNQSIILQPSANIATSTPALATLTPAVTPALTPTDWLSALLTTTPTRYPLPTLLPDCGAVKLGSAGTQDIDKSRKILVQGTAILCGQIYFPIVGRPQTISVPEAMIDLDTGTIDPTTADIEFCPGAGTDIFYYFCNVNNASVKEFSLLPQDPKQPTFEDCQNVREPYSRTTDNEPKYACVITNSGNISRLKIEQYNPLENEMSLKVSFVTWEK